jgi:hypothetical protein
MENSPIHDLLDEMEAAAATFRRKLEAHRPPAPDWLDASAHVTTLWADRLRAALQQERIQRELEEELGAELPTPPITQSGKNPEAPNPFYGKNDRWKSTPSS